MRLILFLSSAIVLFITGCSSSVNLVKYNKEGIAPGPVVIFKKSNYHLDIKRELVACGTFASESAKKTDFRIKTTFTLKQNIEKDLDNIFYIDYDDDWFAQKTVEAEYNFYEDGSLKSINNTYDDRSSEVITSIVSTAATLALANIPAELSYFVTDSETKKKKSVVIYLCRDEVRALLANKKVAKDAFDNTRAPIKKAIKDIAKIQEELKKVSDVTDEQRVKTSLKGAKNKLAIAVENYNSAEAKLAAINKKLTKHEHHYVTRNTAASDAWKNKSLTLKYSPGSMLHEWLNPKVIEKNPEIAINIESSLMLTATFEKMGKHLTEMQMNDLLPEVIGGVAYQIPTNGALRICKVTQCNVTASSDDVVAYHKFDVPDSGYFGMLTIESGAFEDSTVTADFSEKGNLTMYKYSRNSPGEDAANSLNNVAEQLKGYKETKNNKPIDDLTKENELLQLQVDNLKLKEDLGL